MLFDVLVLLKYLIILCFVHTFYLHPNFLVHRFFLESIKCVSAVPKLFSGNDELFCETKYLVFFVTVSYILPSLRCTLLPYLIRR
jgi:hypothetical protein